MSFVPESDWEWQEEWTEGDPIIIPVEPDFEAVMTFNRWKLGDDLPPVPIWSKKKVRCFSWLWWKNIMTGELWGYW